MNKVVEDLYQEAKMRGMVYSLKAIELAEAAHAGQKRKFTGEDYINHPVRVAWRCINYTSFTIDQDVAIAICHDVIEDTETSIEDIKDLFNPYIVDGIIALTRKEGENYFDFIMSIRNTPYYRIKIFDLDDNMPDLKEGCLKDKYRFARHVLKQHFS